MNGLCGQNHFWVTENCGWGVERTGASMGEESYLFGFGVCVLEMVCLMDWDGRFDGLWFCFFLSK